MSLGCFWKEWGYGVFKISLLGLNGLGLFEELYSWIISHKGDIKWQLQCLQGYQVRILIIYSGNTCVGDNRLS